MTNPMDVLGRDMIEQRVSGFDWLQAAADLDARGYTILNGLLSPRECERLIELYDQDELFRSRVAMQRHGFGRGEYKYFEYPLVPLISGLRTALYPHLAPVANSWNQALRVGVRYPLALADFLAICHAAGQPRPTPLLLRYGQDDYNCLHQDVYGEHIFPLQATVLLSRPRHDFRGGEFVLTEQRPRMQSRVEVVHLDQGDAVIFAVRHRPVSGKRGFYRVTMRHGISRIHSGNRYAMGIIFHDSL